MSEKKTEPWAKRNRVYRREYQRSWRAAYKAKHGCSYEADRLRRIKQQQETETEAP